MKKNKAEAKSKNEISEQPKEVNASIVCDVCRNKNGRVQKCEVHKKKRTRGKAKEEKDGELVQRMLELLTAAAKDGVRVILLGDVLFKPLLIERGEDVNKQTIRNIQRVFTDKFTQRVLEDDVPLKMKVQLLFMSSRAIPDHIKLLLPVDTIYDESDRIVEVKFDGMEFRGSHGVGYKLKNMSQRKKMTEGLKTIDIKFREKPDLEVKDETNSHLETLEIDSEGDLEFETQKNLEDSDGKFPMEAKDDEPIKFVTANMATVTIVSNGEQCLFPLTTGSLLSIPMVLPVQSVTSPGSALLHRQKNENKINKIEMLKNIVIMMTRVQKEAMSDLLNESIEQAETKIHNATIFEVVGENLLVEFVNNILSKVERCLNKEKNTGYGPSISCSSLLLFVERFLNSSGVIKNEVLKKQITKDQRDAEKKMGLLIELKIICECVEDFIQQI